MKRSIETFENFFFFLSRLLRSKQFDGIFSGTDIHCVRACVRAYECFFFRFSFVSYFLACALLCVGDFRQIFVLYKPIAIWYYLVLQSLTYIAFMEQDIEDSVYKHGTIMGKNEPHTQKEDENFFFPSICTQNISAFDKQQSELFGVSLGDTLLVNKCIILRSCKYMCIHRYNVKLELLYYFCM